MYKYTLIVSQYYHSWHKFIVEHDDKFMDRAKDMARELIEYKRDEDDEREEYLGDLKYNFSTDMIRRRYNINDAGDIYFINCETLEEAIYTYAHSKYVKEEISAKKGYKSKKVTEAIDINHKYEFVRNIVKKHFNIL